VFALAVDRRAPAGWAALRIGLAVASAILVTGPVTGGSLSPAPTFGPVVVTALGNGPAAWRDLPWRARSGQRRA
jgi:glycerol uptake facilitator protein